MISIVHQNGFMPSTGLALLMAGVQLPSVSGSALAAGKLGRVAAVDHLIARSEVVEGGPKDEDEDAPASREGCGGNEPIRIGKRSRR